MKKGIVVLLFSIIVCVLVGCGDPKADLIGNWYSCAREPEEITILEDGQYIHDNKVEGTWSYYEGSITFCSNDGQAMTCSVEKENQDTVIKYEEATLYNTYEQAYNAWKINYDAEMDAFISVFDGDWTCIDAKNYDCSESKLTLHDDGTYIVKLREAEEDSEVLTEEGTWGIENEEKNRHYIILGPGNGKNTIMSSAYYGSSCIEYCVSITDDFVRLESVDSYEKLNWEKARG